MEPSVQSVQVPPEKRNPAAHLPKGLKPGQVRDPKTGKIGKKALSTEVEDEYVAMRRVANTLKRDDTTVQHARLRKWLEEDVRGFMSRLGKLEDDRREQSRKADGSKDGPGEGAGKPDEGSERAAELWERLLGEWEAEHGDRGRVGS